MLSLLMLNEFTFDYSFTIEIYILEFVKKQSSKQSIINSSMPVGK